MYMFITCNKLASLVEKGSFYLDLFLFCFLEMEEENKVRKDFGSRLKKYFSSETEVNSSVVVEVFNCSRFSLTKVKVSKKKFPGLYFELLIQRMSNSNQMFRFGSFCLRSTRKQHRA